MFYNILGFGSGSDQIPAINPITFQDISQLFNVTLSDNILIPAALLYLDVTLYNDELPKTSIAPD
jgi:hypothetical protein